MKHFYLVARGRFDSDVVSGKTKGSGLLSSTGLIHTDYMGSAEFEWGAIPRFYRRVMQRFNDYIMINLKDEIGIETLRGVPFWAFIHKNDKEAFIESIFDYISDLTNRGKVRKWRLKEWTNIDDHFFVNEFQKPHSRLPNFWYSIDGISDEYTVGDWFMFVGTSDRKNAFLETINNDYQNWWLTLPEEDRNKDYRWR